MSLFNPIQPLLFQDLPFRQLYSQIKFRLELHVYTALGGGTFVGIFGFLGGYILLRKPICCGRFGEDLILAGSFKGDKICSGLIYGRAARQEPLSNRFSNWRPTTWRNLPMILKNQIQTILAEGICKPLPFILSQDNPSESFVDCQILEKHAGI